MLREGFVFFAAGFAGAGEFDLALADDAGVGEDVELAVEFDGHGEGDTVAFNFDVFEGNAFVIGVEFASHVGAGLGEAEGDVLAGVRELAGPDSGEVGGGKVESESGQQQQPG